MTEFNMPNTERVLTLAEVQKHNTNGDCWIIVDGKVYNATPYLSKHPGGKDIVLTHAGGDATSGFTDTGHSASAKQDLAKLQVGVLSAKEKEEVVRLAKEKAEKEGSGIGVAAFVAAGVGLAGMLAWQFLGAGKK